VSAALVVCVALVASQAPAPAPAAPAYASRSEPIMSTSVDVTLPAERIEDAALVFDTFRSVEVMMSEWREGSPLAAVNRAAGDKAVGVPQELYALLERSIAIARETDGAFDPSWAALWGVWDFKANPPVLPERARVDAARALIDARRIVLDAKAHTVFLPTSGMKLGLGGIAKGYALDRAVAALRKKGVPSFLLSAGGQVYAGKGPEGRPWRVGVRDPRGGADDFFAVIEVEDASVSTSGDYERFFIKDSVRYHHILDPRTGFPSTGLRSATVVCADGTLADALSTAVMVLGATRGLALIERQPACGAAVVDELGQLFVSERLKPRFVKLRAPRRN
jgi:FAD:protein FMN transferase